MIRLLVAIGATFLLTNPLLAESDPSAADCQQIRQAVAQYGYAAARRYAQAHYGTDAVKYGDRCLARKHRVKG